MSWHNRKDYNGEHDTDKAEETTIECDQCFEEFPKEDLLEIENPFTGKIEGHICEVCNDGNFQRSLEQ